MHISFYHQPFNKSTPHGIIAAMVRVEAVVYGASNAAGWSPGHDVDYDIAKLAQVTHAKPPFVTVTDKEIVVDLSANPQIEDDDYVKNEGIPGATTPDLLEDFKQQVLGHEPKHVFIWTGLNDPVIAISVLHPRDAREEAQGEIADMFRRSMARAEDTDTKLQASAEFIVANIKAMVDLARENGVNSLIGTLPPFASTLKRFEKDPTAPMGKHLLGEGKVLIRLVNERIQALGGACVVDAYSQVVDAVTGLVRPEFSYGVSVPERSGDILHLNSYGHIAVATVLCIELQGSPVSFIPPDRERLQHS